MPTAFLENEFLTRKELAARLKFTVSGVRKLTERRLIPAVKISRNCVRYRWRDVEAALAKVTIKAVGT